MRGFWIAVGLLLGGTAVQAQHSARDSTIASPPPEYKRTLERFCAGCHNPTLSSAGLSLDDIDITGIGNNPGLWEKVLWRLKTRSMPPVGLPRPDEAFYRSFTAYLEEHLDRAAARRPEPGRTVAAHRLNRTEYTNVIRDLLAVEIDGPSLLPPDNSGGFDNMGELLSVSQVLMERYMSVARVVSQLAVGDPSMPPDTRTYTVSPYLLQHERMGEDLPFGTRGGLAFTHRFPLDGEYELKIRLQRSDQEALIIGIAEPHRLDVRAGGERLKLFELGGENRGLAQADDGMADPRQSDYERTADDILTVRFPAEAGSRLVQVAFLDNEDHAWEGQAPPPDYDNYFVAETGETPRRAWTEPAVSNVTVIGPFEARGPGNTPSRDRIFTCDPGSRAEERACAGEILAGLTRLAYRRPVGNGDLAPLLKLYDGIRDGGGGFEAGIQMALEGLLTSPGFLFRIEHDPAGAMPGEVYRIDDLALASRLSFFLWSSIPDAELLGLAEKGKLRNAAVLDRQVERMLNDRRAASLRDNFAAQWLLLRNLPHTEKNREMFPDFDENLSLDLAAESRLFLASVFRDNRSILDLFRADYRFLNERLARHYGIPGIHGNKFRRVTVEDRNKRGLLAHGAVLAITSYPNRTSPVLRGKWVLENLLASPPPPPPPNIPALKEEDEAGKALTMREAIEKHRANPVCAVCHARMDPIGFGLENFNPVGQWRTEDAGKPIDASGRLPDGVAFQGPAELQDALLARAELIAGAFTRKLMTYAVGRDLEYYDMAAVREVVRQAGRDGYRFADIVSGIVKSVPFQMRRSGP